MKFTVVLILFIVILISCKLRFVIINCSFPQFYSFPFFFQENSAKKERSVEERDRELESISCSDSQELTNQGHSYSHGKKINFYTLSTVKPLNSRLLLPSNCSVNTLLKIFKTIFFFTKKKHTEKTSGFCHSNSTAAKV